MCFSPGCLLERPLYSRRSNCLNLVGVQPKKILNLDANVGVWQDAVRPSAGALEARVNERRTSTK